MIGLEKHFRDLREVLVCYFIVVLAIFLFSYKNSNIIIARMLSGVGEYKHTMYFFNPAEGFTIHLKISIYSALILSIPYGMYKLFWFAKPALLKEEKANFIKLLLASFVLFLLGLIVAYFWVIPVAWDFFTSFETNCLYYLPSLSGYTSMFFGLLMVFSLCFQIPIILIILNRLGVVTKQGLKSFRRYNTVLTFIIAAVLTPPDVASQVCLSVIILLLYELTIFFMKDTKNA